MMIEDNNYTKILTCEGKIRYIISKTDLNKHLKDLRRCKHLQKLALGLIRMYKRKLRQTKKYEIKTGKGYPINIEAWYRMKFNYIQSIIKNERFEIFEIYK